MKINSIVGIMPAAKDLKTLGQFLTAFEKKIPEGCAVMILPDAEELSDFDSMLAWLYHSTILPVMVAHPNMQILQRQVYVIPNTASLILDNPTLQLAPSTADNLSVPDTFWKALSSSGISGLAAVVLAAEPGKMMHLNAINEAGGITLFCLPDELGLTANPHLPDDKTFNYIQPPADLALTTANFLNLFNLPDSKNRELDEGLLEAGSLTPTIYENQPETSVSKSEDEYSTLIYAEVPDIPPLALPPVQEDLANLLLNTQTAILFFDHELRLQHYNNLALQYATLTNRDLEAIHFLIPLPNILNEAREVLRTGTSLEYYLPDGSGRPTTVKVFLRTGVNPSGIGISFTPISRFEHLQQRFQLLANELETQGLEHIRTIIKLRQEVATNETQRQLLESVLGNMGEGVLATNEQGMVILLNEVVKQITGLHQVNTNLIEWVEQNYRFYLPSGSIKISGLQQPFVRALKGHPVVGEEWSVVHLQSSEERFWQIHSRPYKSNNKGEESGVVIVISDITDRKKAELALKNSEQTQKALLDAVPDLMFRVNREGIYLDYIPEKTDNPIPSAAFVGNKMTDLLPREVAEEVMDLLRLSLDTMEVKTYPFDYVGNVIKFYEVRFSPISHQEALGIVRDVTDMIVGKDALQRGTKHYRKLINVSSFPVLVCNRKGEIISANPASARLLNAAEESELTGKFIEDFVIKKHRLLLREAIKNGFVEAESLKTKPLTFITFNNNEVEAVVTGSIITYDNKLSAQIILQDITPLMNWEKAYQLFADSITEAAIWLDASKLEIVNCNQAFLNLLRIRQKKEAVKKKLLQYSASHQSDGSSSATGLSQIMKQIANSKEDNSLFAWRFKSTEGAEINTQITLKPFTASGNGIWLVIIQPVY